MMIHHSCLVWEKAVLASIIYVILDHILWSAIQLTKIYLTLLCSDCMNTQNTWNKMVHAPFKKVVKFDLICMALGAVMGMGAGAYFVASGLFG